mgnify:CR=1 FL=1
MEDSTTLLGREAYYANPGAFSGDRVFEDSEFEDFEIQEDGRLQMSLLGATTATRIRTTAKVSFEKQAEGFAITRIDLDTEAQVPGIDDAAFQKMANGAKEGCPVSKALAGVSIELEAELEQ